MSYWPNDYNGWRKCDDAAARAIERTNEIEQRAIERTIEKATTEELRSMSRDRVLAKAENVARDHDFAELNAEVVS